MKYAKQLGYLAILVALGVGLGFCARSILVGKGAPEISFVSSVNLMFMATALVLGAVIVPLTLALLARKPPRKSRRRIIGLMLYCIVTATLILLLGVRALDRSLLTSVEEYPTRHTLGGQTRSVRMSPIPSKAIYHLEIPDRGTLHSGFGVARESFEAIPRALSYDISVSSPGKPPEMWTRKLVSAETPTGWADETLDLAPLEGGALEIIMKVDYADSSFLSEAFSLCGYYAKLIFTPDYRFDISVRSAVWIEPTVAPIRKPDETNIILIGIDALRADHMSAYGYERATTPNIDAFAESAAIFRNSYSAAPWTLPSFFSILTSTYPSVHQYGTNIHGEVGERSAAIWKIGTISPDYNIKRLAETLREQ